MSTSSLPFTVEPIRAGMPFGAVVRGLRQAHLASEPVREALRRQWIQDGVLVFRDGDNSEDFLVDLSSVFGELEAHPLKDVRNEGRPEIITIFAKPGDNTVCEVEGERGANWLGWHTDLVYVERINHGGILRSLKPTEKGGLTGFLDQVAAYDALPDDLKAAIEGLSVVYKMGPFPMYKYGYRGELKIHNVSAFYQKIWDQTDDFPEAVHPMVWTQPETGRKLLNISPFFALYIEGMKTPEGDALLKRLCDHINECPSYHHKWSTEELVLWDNWRMLHSVTPIPLDEERTMQRTTIKGDYGAGRLLKDLQKAA